MQPPPSGRPPARPRAERGVALLVVLVVLFIVAVLMVDVSLTAETARRSARNSSSEFLMDAAIDARLQVVLAQILYDSRANKTDSLDDRWAREEFTDVKPDEEAQEARRRSRDPDDEDYDDTAADVLGDTAEVSIKVRVEDEERKFNLNTLMDSDKTRREAARERFAVLLDRYREDTPLDLSPTTAANLRDRIVEYLERRTPAEGSTGEMPVPATGNKTARWYLLTPDELRNVKGFEDTGRGWTADILLYDAREPEEATRYAENPEGDAPEVYPGLIRYITLWSGGAWLGETNEGDKWVPININTAEKCVLETLFYKSQDDMHLVDDIIEYRGQEKEGSPTGEDELASHQVFETLDDLKKVEGIDDQVFTRNGISAATATVVSNVFSIDFLADREGAKRQVRYVVRRHQKGFQTLLREERADPRFEFEDEDEETDDDL